jgi:colanic acid biosynthesis glycosyl transferase WcaI
MKRIIFLNRFFFPDHSATSQMVTSLAFRLAEFGWEVHIITSQQLYNNPQALLPAREIVHGVHIHRVASSKFGRSKLLGRALDYLSFYFFSWRRLRALATRGDVVIAMTDPPLLSLVAVRAAKRRGAHLVNWLQDVYPEVAIQLGVRFLRGPVGHILSYFRDISLNVAKANVVVGQCMAERVRSRGISADRIHVIHNWSADEQISPVCNTKNPLREKWGLADKFVIGYSGNLGRAHEFETLLTTSERFRNNPNIIFLFIGGGHQLDELTRRVKQLGLGHSFQFIPYQDHANLKYSLCVPDVHWISLRPELEGLIVPSKFYGIAAAGRPMIAITAKDGEVARLIDQHQCGLLVEPGNVDGLEKAIVLLSTDNGRRAAMGTCARMMLEAQFTSRQAFEHWRDLLDKLGLPEA